ncbi:hypothetical protein B7760_04263 [Burkholderia glumae]|nr:hypothetical protein B7760_04263 [Burkholderia glumae]
MKIFSSSGSVLCGHQQAKAGTDKTDSTGDIRQAQKQLGHTTIGMTEHYVRNRRGDKVKPTR